jgi:hypothetical protein
VTPAFDSPLDDDLVSLSIAARLVLHYVHSTRYIDPDATPAAELRGAARRIADVVPLIRLDKTQSRAALLETEDLDQWSIRRGDLRTALRLFGNPAR